MRPFATLLLLCLLAAPALAQTSVDKEPPRILSTPAPPVGPQDCALGTASTDLAFGDVRARLYNAGQLFWNGGQANYEVPKGGGVAAIFAAGVWVGGLVGGELRTAAATYAQGGNYEFYPGPLDENGTPPADCSLYDRIWTVNVGDVEHYDATGEATPDLAEWPVHLGAAVIDGDGIEDNYDLEAGDRPAIYGHETAFWVMNDAGGPHTSSGSEPIGLEVRATAFAAAGPSAALDQATFYRYELHYRGEGPASPPLEDAYFTLWTDPDLGDYLDDSPGTDSTRGLAFVYNSDNDDSEGNGGYGVNPPAVGYDFLNGAGSSIHFFNSGQPETGIPDDSEAFYHYAQGTWGDGTPLTEGGDGFNPEGSDELDYLFPGDPLPPDYWSARCTDPACDEQHPGNDVRGFVLSTPAFTLEPGETRTVDIAILFARGDDHLDSITELKTASDAVQARYDAGELFAPFASPPSLAAPTLLGPPDGAEFYDERPTFSWEPVPGADLYLFEITSPDGQQRRTRATAETSLSFRPTNVTNEVEEFRWRVRAENDEAVGVYSDTRSFRFYRYEPAVLGDGDGIVEIANPAEPPCPDPGDAGCGEYGGNTVWEDPNVTDDYLITSLHGLRNLLPLGIAREDDFELRFTDECATFGNCLGVYDRMDGHIVSVPFELWNIRDADDPNDDVQMIPALLPYEDYELPDDWTDTFTGTSEVSVEGVEVELPVTERVFGMMPDRPNGYDLFEAAAHDFGGPGALYDPENDGDTQIDTTATGEPCPAQGYYIDFCYRNDKPYWGPLGGALPGVILADFAGDGTTPLAGTTVRFQTVDQLVDNEDDGPGAQPQTLAIESAYPNPFRDAATVAYRVGEAGEVRLSVFDVLGRRVAVLAEGPAVAGEHRAVFDAGSLASGVYLVVLEAGGERHTKKVLLVR